MLLKMSPHLVLMLLLMGEVVRDGSSTECGHLTLNVTLPNCYDDSGTRITTIKQIDQVDLYIHENSRLVRHICCKRVFFLPVCQLISRSSSSGENTKLYSMLICTSRSVYRI